MSFLSSIRSTLSEKWLREKLTIEERAKILVSITNDLQWRTYKMPDGHFDDMRQAIADLGESDLERIKYEKDEHETIYPQD